MIDQPSYAICFLNINEMGKLAKTSIGSALVATDCPIFIGTDIKSNVRIDFDHQRIKILELELDSSYQSESIGRYQDFNSDLFYVIVQYKWKLLLKMLEMDFDYIIFSDTDVFWKKNPISDLIAGFSHDPEKEIFIQDATLRAQDIRLCMGFVIFRKSDRTKTLVRRAYEMHLEMSQSQSRVGDDDVISAMYREPELRNLIGRLPQISYPVGIFINLFITKNRLPGLSPNDPFIFHANYAIGLRRKYLLMKLFIAGKGIQGFFKMPIQLRMFNLYLRLRLRAGKTRKFLRF